MGIHVNRDTVTAAQLRECVMAIAAMGNRKATTAVQCGVASILGQMDAPGSDSCGHEAAVLHFINESIEIAGAGVAAAGGRHAKEKG